MARIRLAAPWPSPHGDKRSYQGVKMDAGDPRPEEVVALEVVLLPDL